MINDTRPKRRAGVWAVLLIQTCVLGCGTTRSRTATEQLLTSDAVDRTVAQIDFRPLAGEKVFLDTQYMKGVKSVGFVNSDYITSSLRQQMIAAGCLLHEKQDEADFVVEARVGALGTNSHDITYGIPSSNGISTAASFLPSAPQIPMIPEMSVARKDDQLSAAKIALFAYNRQTKAPVWQSGMSVAKATAKDTWVFGAGPFQNGTIYDGAQFAGARFSLPLLGRKKSEDFGPKISYFDEHIFSQAILAEAAEEKEEASVKQAAHAAEEKSDKTPSSNGDSPK